MGLLRSLPPQLLPFADAASDALPLGRLLRLSLFQVTVGMAIVLLNGTLNRVMVVELGIPVWLVSFMVSLPILFAPLRALIGHRSDNHVSALGWRRVPYLFIGSLMQYGGLAIMPMAILVLSGGAQVQIPFAGEAAAALAFLMVGFGLHTTQTAGLALATDIAPEESRPRVVALLYVMLLVGMMVSAAVFGWVLQADFRPTLLVQLVQGAAVVSMVLNIIAVWQQEVRAPQATSAARERPSFRASWSEFSAGGQAARLLVIVGIGTAAFSMQDILLEPYGGEVLRLSVGATTALTALLAAGTLMGFAWSARALGRGRDPNLVAAIGLTFGIPGFTFVIFADPMGSTILFQLGTVLIGLGSGCFGVGTMVAAMALSRSGKSGLALGAWGAVQATAAGAAILVGGFLRDGITALAVQGALGAGLKSAAVGYSFVYHIEIGLLFLTLMVIGPMVRFGSTREESSPRFGLAELPG
ncbi:MAG: BCD family MFS transporter [Myxococcota bacterium]